VLKGEEWRQPGLVALASKLAMSARAHLPIKVLVPTSYAPKTGANLWIEVDDAACRESQAVPEPGAQAGERPGSRMSNGAAAAMLAPPTRPAPLRRARTELRMSDGAAAAMLAPPPRPAPLPPELSDAIELVSMSTASPEPVPTSEQVTAVPSAATANERPAQPATHNPTQPSAQSSMDGGCTWTRQSRRISEDAAGPTTVPSPDSAPPPLNPAPPPTESATPTESEVEVALMPPAMPLPTQPTAVSTKRGSAERPSRQSIAGSSKRGSVKRTPWQSSTERGRAERPSRQSITGSSKRGSAERTPRESITGSRRRSADAEDELRLFGKRPSRELPPSHRGSVRSRQSSADSTEAVTQPLERLSNRIKSMLFSPDEFSNGRFSFSASGRDDSFSASRRVDSFSASEDGLSEREAGPASTSAAESPRVDA
jgi:hypothetical protein